MLGTSKTKISGQLIYWESPRKQVSEEAWGEEVRAKEYDWNCIGWGHRASIPPGPLVKHKILPRIIDLKEWRMRNSTLSSSSPLVDDGPQGIIFLQTSGLHLPWMVGTSGKPPKENKAETQCTLHWDAASHGGSELTLNCWTFWTLTSSRNS